MTRCCARIGGTILFAVLACSAAGAWASEDDRTLMDVLGQGIEILRSGVEFRSNVIYREAWVGSKEAGLTGEYGSRIGKPGDEVKATGVFHKLGDLVRVSLQWGRSSEVSSDGKKLATATSFDSVTTKRLFLNWV